MKRNDMICQICAMHVSRARETAHLRVISHRFNFSFPAWVKGAGGGG